MSPSTVPSTRGDVKGGICSFVQESICNKHMADTVKRWRVAYLRCARISGRRSTTSGPVSTVISIVVVVGTAEPTAMQMQYHNLEQDT